MGKFLWRALRIPPQLLYKLGFGRIYGRLVLLLTTTGRKSSKPHVTPLQYEEIDGEIYIGAARGQEADWFRNIVANPHVAVEVKSRRFRGVAEPITDPARIADFLALRMQRHPKMVGAILRIAGLPSKPTHAQLEEYALNRAMVVIRQDYPVNTKEKKTALITGATSGIGAEYARRFAREGYDLIITGRREAKIKALADELSRENNVNVEVILIELSNTEEVDDFLEGIKCKDIDVLINNAGFGILRFFHREPLKIQEDMVAVNILCAMKLTYAILPRMLKKGSGIIINVSSSGAFMSTPNEATYVGTKAFLRAFSEALYFELIGTGVKIQAVCPGLTKTDMPIRLGIPEDQMVDRGPFKWITPKDVVDASLKCLKSNKVVCIPGWLTRFQVFMRSILPDSIYYKSAYSYFKKYGWIEEIQQKTS